MNKINKSIANSPFKSVPKGVIGEILMEAFSPRARQVCKLFREIFDKNCHRFLIKKLENGNVNDLVISRLLTEYKDDKKNEKINPFKILKNFFYFLRNRSELIHLVVRNNPLEPCDFRETLPRRKIKFENIIQEMQKAFEDGNLVNCTRLSLDLGLCPEKFSSNAIKSKAKQTRKHLETESTQQSFAASNSLDYDHDGCSILFAVPSQISCYKNLKFFRATCNQLHFLSDEFCLLNHLEQLYLDRNYLTDFPNQFGNLAALTILSVTENYISFLPPSFCNLTNLQILDLRENKLESLPPNFGNLISLYELNLSDNKLPLLPHGIWNLTNLKSLNLANNQLYFLPTGMEKSIVLKELNLQYNNLSQLPSGLSQLTTLEVLNVSNNQLLALPKMKLLTKLTELHVKCNACDLRIAEALQIEQVEKQDTRKRKRDLEIDFPKKK